MTRVVTYCQVPLPLLLLLLSAMTMQSCRRSSAHCSSGSTESAMPPAYIYPVGRALHLAPSAVVVVKFVSLSYEFTVATDRHPLGSDGASRTLHKPVFEILFDGVGYCTCRLCHGH